MARCKCCFEEYDEAIAQGVCPRCGYYEGKKPKDFRYLPMGTLVHDRYIVGGAIAAGGFGITYWAWDQNLQTTLALKEYYQIGVVNRVPGTTEVFIAAKNRAEEFYYGEGRLLREAQIVSKFQSASIMRVNDFFEENGTSYMVMELLDYPTLEDYLLLRNKPLEVDEAVSVGRQLCEALQEIHAAGVIHRDIAPDNIFITPEGRIKVIDFGSARLSRDDVVEKLVLVKEGFSPIEQYEAINLKQDLQRDWTDVYAVGATLYYCLTGVRPEESRIRKAALDEKRADIKEPMELNPAVPENLNNTIMKAMAINIHERFQTAEELAKALQDEVKVLPLPVYRKRKRMARALGIGGGLAAAAAIIIFSAGRGITDYDEITLEPAEISIWYCGSEDGEKAAALKEVLSYTGAQFDNVTINWKGFSDSTEYAAALEEAYQSGQMPTVFECVDIDADYMKGVDDVSSITGYLTSENSRACYFLRDGKSTVAQAGSIPLGFQIPVIYINPDIVTDYVPGSSISSMGELLSLAEGELASMPIAVDSETQSLFSAMFSDYADHIGSLDIVTEEEFLAGQAAVYLAGTGKFSAVNSRLPKAKLASAPSDQIVCGYTDYWSISGGNSTEEQEAAEVFVSKLFSDNAQEYYFVEGRAGESLPLNKLALEQYADAQPVLRDLIENCGSYTVSASE